MRYPDRYGGTPRPLAFSFAICARVAAFPATTLLQAAALRVETKEVEDGLAVGPVLVAMALDLAGTEVEVLRVEAVAVLEMDGVDDVVVGVERAEVAKAAETDELEAVVIGVVLEEAATGVLDVTADGVLEAAVDTIACGAASAVAAKSRTRDVGFILMGCWIEGRRLKLL